MALNHRARCRLSAAIRRTEWIAAPRARLSTQACFSHEKNSTSTPPWGWAFAAAALGGVASSRQQGCIAAPIEADYAPGKAIGGEGLRAELWKAKHLNINVKEIEDDSPALLLLSHVRDVSTVGADFVHFADRLMVELLNAAYMELPNDDEAVFTTPSGDTMEGVMVEEGADVCVVSLRLDKDPHQPFTKALADVFPKAEHGSLQVNNFTTLGDISLPEVLEEKTMVLLVPLITAAEPVLVAIDALEEAGVEQDKIIVVTVCMSRDAADAITKRAKDVTVITGAVDAMDTKGELHPGVGDFSQRYTVARKEAKKKGHLLDLGSAPPAQPAGRKRWLGIF